MDLLSPLDRGLTTELVLGSLRWRNKIDWLIDQVASRESGEIDIRTLIILRIGAYQIKFLSKIPIHAAVNEAVNLAKIHVPKTAGFVNAILRKIDRERDLEKKIDLLQDPAQRIAISQSQPEWLIRRWLDRFGEDTTSALAAAYNKPPRAAIHVNSNKISEHDLRARLKAEGIDCMEGTYVPGCLLLPDAAATHSESYKQGLFFFQDEASQMIPYLGGLRERNRVVDVCSAPGGKAILLSYLVGHQGLVFASDRFSSRQALLKRRIDGLDIRNIRILIADGTQPLPFRGQFDGVLIDAPCSGLGTLRRNPELKWKLAERELLDLGAKQERLLRSASAIVKKGGFLLYSTCSTEPEENERVVEAFLAEAKEFALVSPAVPESWGQFITAQNYFQTFPVDLELDGFFAALLQRKC